jgi:hypothetical protein
MVIGAAPLQASEGDSGLDDHVSLNLQLDYFV